MTEKFSNFSLDSKGHHTLYTTSLLMTPLKFVKFRFQTQEKIHSQSLSKDKNFLVNLHSTNQAKHMLKISSKPRNFLLVNIQKYLVVNIYLKDAISSQEITMLRSMVLSNLKTLMFLKIKDNKDQVIFLIYEDIIIPPHNGIGSE